MAGTFVAGCEAMKERVGDGELTGKVEVNQHYAFEQHENFGYAHPRGGGPHYLLNPLMQSAEGYLMTLGAAVLGGDLTAAMIANMEDLSSQLDPAAPIDADPNFYRLRRSGNPKVFDQGAEVYNRPPIDPRMPPGFPGS